MATPVVPPSSTAVISEPAPLSEGSRIIDTFIAPSKTFTDLKRSAAWWGPFLLMIVVSALFSYTVGQRIGFRQAAENVMQTRTKQWDRIQQMPPDQMERTMNFAAKQTMITSYGFPLVNLILLLIIAGVLLATFKVLANAAISYKAALAIVVYASLPGVLKYLLATLTLYLGVAADGFNIQNPIATNLGAFFNALENPVLYTAASMVDVFMLWTLALTAIGFTCVGKIKRGTAFGVVFAWYVAFGVIVTGLVAVAS